MKIRVMQILPTLKRAGAERMVVSLAKGLDDTRFESCVVSLFNAFPGGLEQELEGCGIPVMHLGKRKGLDLRMVPRLRQCIRQFRPDIIHSHSYLLRYSVPAALWSGTPVMVHTVHNVAQKEANALGRIINRIAYRSGVVPVAIGDEVRVTFREVYGFEPEATIPNGVDLSPFAGPARAGEWKLANGFAAAHKLAVSVARLERQKNPIGLVEAFAKGMGREPEWQLLLAGGGSLETELRRRIAQLGLEKRIHLLGVSEDVAGLLLASDMFVLGSDWEGVPLAVIEAMAAGLPVVATAVGGLPELVADGESGVLVPAGDPRALANALKRLALDEGLRQRMGTAARIRARMFSVEAMVAAYASLFERLARPTAERGV